MLPKQMGRAAVHWLDSRSAARLVWVVAVMTLVFCAWLGVEQYQLQRCQFRYAEASSVSQRARAEAAEVDRQAQDKMFRAVVDNPRASIDAIREYNQSRDVANAQRAKNPIPPAPSTNCG